MKKTSKKKDALTRLTPCGQFAKQVKILLEIDVYHYQDANAEPMGWVFCCIG